jgi:hypothetical protein
MLAGSVSAVRNWAACLAPPAPPGRLGTPGYAAPPLGPPDTAPAAPPPVRQRGDGLAQEGGQVGAMPQGLADVAVGEVTRPKVILTAVARRLLVIANATIRSGRPRQAELATAR